MDRCCVEPRRQMGESSLGCSGQAVAALEGLDATRGGGGGGLGSSGLGCPDHGVAAPAAEGHKFQCTRAGGSLSIHDCRALFASVLAAEGVANMSGVAVLETRVQGAADKVSKPFEKVERNSAVIEAGLSRFEARVIGGGGSTAPSMATSPSPTRWPEET